ncbi:sulfotransferase [Thioalkalivibrio sp. AKL17]|uniref:sulfotransferase n=1 Tax=Thioalkalivibrio sp. AKL17 TaxID=1158160 RepID=UPI0009DA5647|nr:sulfotransferase [Thioalkalivibrio sp. AKL17]
MDQQTDPVLIVGSGRSGTTFLAKLLDSHSRVLYRHEPDWARVDTSLPFLPPPGAREGFSRQAGEYLHELAQVRAPKVTGKEPRFRKSYRSGPREVAYRLNVAAARTLAKLGFARKRDVVWDMIGNASRGDVVTVIKSVNSVARAPLFVDALPGIRLVHLIRHPAGVVASRMRGVELGLMGTEVYIDALFDSGYADNWKLKREEVKAWPIEKQMAFEWMAVNEAVYRSLEGHDAYLCVTHDALSRSTEEETRKVFAHVGLDWSEQTDRFIRSLRTGASQSGYFGVQRAPRTEIGKWRKELTTGQIDRIHEVVERSMIGEKLWQA